MWITTGGAIVIAATLLVQLHHWLAFIILLPGMMLAFTYHAWIRIGLLTVVAMQAFGSSSGFNLQKLAWVALVPVTLAFAARSKSRLDLTMRPGGLITTQIIWTGYLALSVARSLLAGRATADVFRDSVPYITWSFALMWALDLSTSGAATVKRLAISVAGLSAVGMGLTWVTMRGGAALPSSMQFGTSMSMAGLGVILSASMLICRGTHPLPALCFTVSCIGLILSGSRTFLIVPVSLLVLLAGVPRLGLKGIFRLGAIAGLICLSLKALPAVTELIGVHPDFLTRRSMALLNFSQSHDASALGRARSYDEALRVWMENPLWGKGPGPIFTSYGGLQTTSLDTPLTFPAKFGILGIVILVALILQLIKVVRSVAKSADLEWRLATTAFGVYMLMYLPFGGAFDDKGLGLALCLILGGTLTSARETHASRPST